MENPEEEESLLVESGTFRVDRARALEKLMRFQLPDARHFILSWVRCAVASSATFIRLSGNEEFLEMSFDGRPFTKEELEQPYGSLFERKSAEQLRDRHLAIGILSALRFRPKQVSAHSGVAPARFILRLESLESEGVLPSENPARETILRVAWGEERVTPEDMALLLGERCAMVPVPLLLSFKDFNGSPPMRRPLPRPAAPLLDFDQDGVRGQIGLYLEGPQQSVLHLHTSGVHVATMRPNLLALSGPSFCADVNDDLLTLNASQSGVVNNSRFQKMTVVLAQQAEKLLLDVVQLHNSNMLETASLLLKANLHAHWQNWLERPITDNAKGLLGVLGHWIKKNRQDELSSPILERLHRDANVMLWVREACRLRLAQHDKDMKDPVRRALREAAVFVGANGAPLSLAALEAQRAVLGYVPYSTRPFPGLRPAFAAAWITSAHDLEFLQQFARGATDATEALGKEHALPAHPGRRYDEQARPSLERAGITSLLIRSEFSSDGLFGEIALPAQPPRDVARIHFFSDGFPDGYLDVRGELHYAAALDRSNVIHSQAANQAAASAAREAALSLYRKLSQEYEPTLAIERNHRIREHLLDFLGWACKQTRPNPPHDWILQTPLFRVQDSWWDCRRLRAALREGKQLYFTQEAQDTQGLPYRFVFVGSRYTPAFLKALLPGAELLSFDSLPNTIVAFQPPERTCGQSECLMEWPLESGVGHLSIGDSDALTGDASLALLLALLRRRGGRLEGPERKFLLETLARHFAPWPGRDAFTELRQSLMEFLCHQPVFRRPQRAQESGGWTLPEMSRRLCARRVMTFVWEGEKDASTDLVLDQAEFELTRKLWPESRYPGALVHSTGKPFLSAALSATAPPSSPERPPLHFNQPMLVTLELEEQGLRALLGLPPELLPGVDVTVDLSDGQSQISSRFTLTPPWPLALAVLLDVSGWKNPLLDRPGGKTHPKLEAALLALALRFYQSLVELWPKREPSPERDSALQLYFLHLLQPAQGESASWDGLREKIRALEMIPCVGGGWTTLQALASQAAEEGVLFYCAGTEKPGLPLLRYPKLTAQALGLDPKGFKRWARGDQAAQEIPAAPDPAAAGSLADGNVGAALVTLIEELKGRRGVDLRQLDASQVLLPDGAGRWLIDKDNSLIGGILASPLDARSQAAYLLSLAFTRANRRAPGVTDRDDIRFQLALLDRLAKGMAPLEEEK